MKIIPKVLPSAQLPNLKGSPSIRNTQAAQFSYECRKWVFGVLKTKQDKSEAQELTFDEIKDFYKQKFPDIKLEVMVNKNKSYSGAVQAIGDKNNNPYKFVMKLNFSENAEGLKVIPKKDIYIFFHENRHFDDFIVNPKIQIRQAILFSLVTGNRNRNIWKFYKKNLYCNKYEMNSKTPLKKLIASFFEKQKFSSDKKITILQSWRQLIRTEINARYDGEVQSYDIFAKLKKEKAKLKLFTNLRNNLSFYFKKLETNFLINEGYLYPQKLKLLESMLAQEIKDHRIKHSESLKARTLLSCQA